MLFERSTTSHPHNPPHRKPHRLPPRPPRPVATDQIQQTVSYTSSLEQDQFRLISLPAVEAYDDPVHVTLEVFHLRSCPEYETVSYTWAGEDGDSSLC